VSDGNVVFVNVIHDFLRNETRPIFVEFSSERADEFVIPNIFITVWAACKLRGIEAARFLLSN
jgi:hypothetical protein